MGDRAILSKENHLGILFSIITVCLSGSVLGIFLWVRSFQFFNFQLSNFEPLSLWILPPGVLLLKYVALIISAYLIFWVFYSFIISRAAKVKFVFSLKQDASSYLPTLFLLFFLLQFSPGPEWLRNFGIFLGQSVGGILILASFLGIISLKYRFLKSIIQDRKSSEKCLSLINRLSQRRVKSLVFTISFLTYLFFTLHIISPNPRDARKYYLLTGDEPHYLLIAHSLIFDRDFNLFNNKLREDWKSFEKRPIDGHAPGFEYFNQLTQGRLSPREKFWEGKEYSVHRVGLPLILGPAYFTGFKWNLRIRFMMMLFLNLCTALIALNIYSLSFEVTGDKFNSLLTWLFLSFTAPVLFYCNKIFPDLIAGLLIIFAFRQIRNLKAGESLKFILAGLVIGFLPWLHERFILTSIILMAYFMSRVKFSFRPVAILMLPVIISFILQAWYYNLLFGTAYPVTTHPFLSFTYGLKYGLPGLLLDRNQGLFLYSPIYILSLTGLFVWFKDKNKNRDWLWLWLIVFANYILTGIFRGWTGGMAPPTRYMMPVAPLLAFPVSYSLCKIKNGAFRFTSLLLGMTGILISSYSMWHPGLLYRYQHPLVPCFDNFINLKVIFPDFLKVNDFTYPLTVFWVAIIVIFLCYYKDLIKHLSLK